MEEEFNPEKYKEVMPKNRSELIESQQKQENKMEIEIGEDKLNVEYQILDVRDENEIKKAQEKGDKTIVVTPGFPASMRNLKELTKSLALEGKKVIVLSFPGFGKSDNPPEKWLGRNLLEKQSEVANQLLDKILAQEKQDDQQITTEQFTVIGPSMGAVLATKLAKNHPERISDLVLLHPAGLPVRQIELMMRSPGGSVREKKAIKNKFEGNPEARQKALERFEEMRLDGAKNWKGWARDKQRLTEVKLMAEGRAGFAEDIGEFKGNISLISGSEDKLFNPNQLEKIKECCKNAKNVESQIIKGTSHSGPGYDAEEYSKEIVNVLNKWREEELKEKQS